MSLTRPGAHHEDSGSYRSGNFIRKAVPRARRDAPRRSLAEHGLGLLRGTPVTATPTGPVPTKANQAQRKPGGAGQLALQGPVVGRISVDSEERRSLVNGQVLGQGRGISPSFTAGSIVFTGHKSCLSMLPRVAMRRDAFIKFTFPRVTGSSGLHWLQEQK
jgi:hypothetical protein